MPYVDNSQITPLYNNTTPGQPADANVIDPAIAAIIAASNENYDEFLAFKASIELPIPDQSIVTRHLRNLAVTNPKLAPLAVTADKIANGAITLEKLADLVITAAKIADGTITESKYATGSVSKRAIAPNSVDASKMDPSLYANITDVAINTRFGKIDAQLAETVSGIVNLSSFGAVPDYDPITETGTDNTAAFVAASAAAGTNRELFIPFGNYYVASDITMPPNVDCQGTIYGGKLIFRQLKGLVIKSLRCQDVLFSGVWRGDIGITSARNIDIDGNTGSWGTVWNVFRIQQSTKVTIDITPSFVNQNKFVGGHLGKILITGSISNSTSMAHMNWFDSIDLSTGGAVQDDSRGHTNYLINCYSEGPANVIVGNWQVIGYTGDRIPLATPDSHILFANTAIPNSSQDFLSLSTSNLVRGGEWDDLDNLGRPSGVSYGSSVGTVISDNTAPDRSGRAVQVTTSIAFGYFQLNLTDYGRRGGVAFYLKGTVSSIVAIGATGTEYYNQDSRTDAGDGWSLVRISLSSGRNINRIRVYLTTTATATTAYFSGVFASAYKATPLPHYQRTRVKGAVSAAPSGGIWDTGDVVLRSAPSVGNNVGWTCTAGGSPGTWIPFGQAGLLTSIAATPAFAGQEAISGGEIYKAVGTSSSADWKQIT